MTDFLRHSRRASVVIFVSCTVLSFYINLYSLPRQHIHYTNTIHYNLRSHRGYGYSWVNHWIYSRAVWLN